LIICQYHYVLASVTASLAKEPLDVTGVIDASPQRCSLSEIVDADAEGSLSSSAPRILEIRLLLLLLLLLASVRTGMGSMRRAGRTHRWAMRRTPGRARKADGRAGGAYGRCYA
jgi:hypothetical protein